MLPLSSIFHPALILSVLGQLLIHAGCMWWAVTMAKEHMGESAVKEVIAFQRKADKEAEAGNEEVRPSHTPNRYMPLHAVTCHIPLHTVTYRYIPLHIVTSFYISSRVVPGELEPQAQPAQHDGLPRRDRPAGRR